MTPIRANIVGPPRFATSIKARIASCHCGALCSAFGKLGDVIAGVLDRDELAPAGQLDWIVERTFPANWIFVMNCSYAQLSHASSQLVWSGPTCVVRKIVARRAASIGSSNSKNSMTTVASHTSQRKNSDSPSVLAGAIRQASQRVVLCVFTL
jgi:hypothetical protein